MYYYILMSNKTLSTTFCGINPLVVNDIKYLFLSVRKVCDLCYPTNYYSSERGVRPEVVRRRQHMHRCSLCNLSSLEIPIREMKCYTIVSTICSMCNVVLNSHFCPYKACLFFTVKHFPFKTYLICNLL